MLYTPKDLLYFQTFFNIHSKTILTKDTSNSSVIKYLGELSQMKTVVLLRSHPLLEGHPSPNDFSMQEHKNYLPTI